MTEITPAINAGALGLLALVLFWVAKSAERSGDRTHTLMQGFLAELRESRVAVTTELHAATIESVKRHAEHEGNATDRHLVALDTIHEEAGRIRDALRHAMPREEIPSGMPTSQTGRPEPTETLASRSRR